jgi:hypothetical protein
MRTVMKPLFLLATVLLATVAVAPTEEARGQETQPGQKTLSKPPSGIAVPPTKLPSRSVVQPTPGRKIERVPFKKGGATVAVAGQCPADCGPVPKPTQGTNEIWCGGATACTAAGAGCSCILWEAPRPQKGDTEAPKWEKARLNPDRKHVKKTGTSYRCWCTQ